MSQQQLTPLEIQALRQTCRMAALYHDSPATKAHACEPWCFCTCRVAESLREADVAICKLEYRPQAVTEAGRRMEQIVEDGRAVNG